MFLAGLLVVCSASSASRVKPRASPLLVPCVVGVVAAGSWGWGALGVQVCHNNTLRAYLIQGIANGEDGGKDTLEPLTANDLLARSLKHLQTLLQGAVLLVESCQELHGHHLRKAIGRGVSSSEAEGAGRLVVASCRLEYLGVKTGHAACQGQPLLSSGQ